MKLMTTIFLFTLISCVKDPKALKVIDDSGSDGEVTSLYELPANSSGDFVVTYPQNPQIIEVNIPAHKTHNPNVSSPGWYYFSESFEFELPETISVSEGQASSSLVVVALKRQASDSLPKNLQCAYVSNGAVSNTYEFDFCIDGAILLTPENYEVFKSQSINVIDSDSRIGNIIRVNRSEKISAEANLERNPTQ